MRFPPDSRPTLNANEDARRFRFEQNHCLYRDHDGNRVLADFEGDGFARVASKVPVLRGLERGCEFASDFRDGLLVRSEEPGEVEVVVATGRTQPVYGPIAPIEGPRQFHGWVVSGDLLQSDGLHRRGIQPSPEFPIPVYRSIDTEGWFGVIEARPDLWESISRWTIEDAIREKGKSFQIQNISRVETLVSSFEDGTPHLAPVASHLNALRFKVEVPGDADAIRIRKVYDRFHGRQRCRVLLDGVSHGIWFPIDEDRDLRWGVTEWGTELISVPHSRSLEIAFDPLAGTPLWSISSVEVWARVPYQPPL